MHGVGDEPAHVIQGERREQDRPYTRAVATQGIQRQQERVRQIDFVVAISSDQQEVARLTAANQVLDQTQGSSVDPLQIVEKQHQWVLGPGEYAQERAKYHLKAVARVLWREVRHPGLLADHQLQFGDGTGDELGLLAR